MWGKLLGAGGSTTLGSFRGSWMPAAWGRVMRTGVNVSYGRDILQRLAVYHGKGTKACPARSRTRGRRRSSARLVRRAIQNYAGGYRSSREIEFGRRTPGVVRPMYIHRIVIDANLINTRGGITAMNRLEALHDAGLVEVFQTSTLAADFRQGKQFPQGQQKARRYATIGSSSTAYLTNTNVADSQLGASGRESRFMEIHRVVFGEPASEEAKRANNMRDALHIDQASQHDADFFITNDGEILPAASRLDAAGIGTRVCTAEDCLARVTAYFAERYGTTDLQALVQLLSQEGPVIVGSNGCGGVAFADVETGEELLAFQLGDAGAAIRAIIRRRDGAKVVTVVPGHPISFEGPGPSICMEVGLAPVLVGDKHCRSFAITENGSPMLAGRILRLGRLLIHEARLYTKSGRLALRVAREVLELSGATVSELLAP